MTTFLNRLSNTAATRIRINIAFSGTPVYHDGLAYDGMGPDTLIVNYAGTPAFYQAGIGFTTASEMCVVDASAGLPADTSWQSGLPISRAQARLCVDPTGAVTYWHDGVPFTAVGAVAVDTAAGAVGFNIVTIDSGCPNGYGDAGMVARLSYGTDAAGGGFYNNRATFLAAHPALTLQDFTGIAPPGGEVDPAPAFSGFVLDSTPFAGNDTAVFDSAAFPTAFCFLYSTPIGPFHLHPEDPYQDNLMRLTFSPIVRAVGFNITLFSQFSALGYSATVKFYNGATLLTSQTFTVVDGGTFTTFAGYAL